MSKIKEFHLFVGIGGEIYGGELLGHKCRRLLKIVHNAEDKGYIMP